MSVAYPGSFNRASQYRGKDDAYSTPRCASVPFLQEHKLSNQYVWEPACGSGALSETLREFGYRPLSSNLVDYDYGHVGVDFLKETQLRCPVIITNPPFGIVDDFILHALDLGVLEACFFLRTKFLEGAKRYERILSKHPPKIIYQFIERIVFFSDAVPKKQQPGWNTEAFAWFVWEKGFKGDPIIKWLRRGEQG